MPDHAVTTTVADPTVTTTTTAPWHGFTAPEDVSFVDNKGWKGPADVIASYRGLEKLHGRPADSLMAIPRADDPDGMRQAFAKLGLPDAPDKYEIAKPDGFAADEAYTTWAKTAFHKAGLTAAQAKALSAEHNAYVKGVLDKQAEDGRLKTQAEQSELLREWGDGHERMVAASRAAANALGFNQDIIDAIEGKVGYKGTMKLFANLGQKLGEDGFVSGGPKGGGTGSTFGNITPQEAKSQIDAMGLDPEQRKAMFDKSHPQHKAMVEKRTRLFNIAFPSS